MQVCRLSPFDPPPFDSAKLKVEYIGGSGALGPHPSVAPRRYTLTHNDLTGELFLSVGSEFNVKQVGHAAALLLSRGSSAIGSTCGFMHYTAKSTCSK